MSTVHDAVAANLSSFGGYLRCEHCGDSRPLGVIAPKLSGGWPACCGYTMCWWTQRQIDACAEAVRRHNAEQYEKRKAR